ncbi:hypothetical protein [Acidovorax sp. MR-S7]|uniref:hypothetical protein n=1 Tax=Acidovorax sp. MR-S7 TaxID=1268622 RepID=UPI0003AACD77|nr:hypothetical protein [Acidovorax sp. MR-S7]GAD24526.1 hypothetical protein AVS7_04286 [Acidovorax sp. MR-S7]
MHPLRAPYFFVLPVALACLLTACGGGGGGDDATSPPSGDGFTLGGAVTGLGQGKRLVLQNNGAADLDVAASGTFTFAGRIAAGSAYAVTVKTQPQGQTCAVAQGSGTATANVGDVAVRCADLPAARYSVGGTVSGLAAGGGLVLQNNGGDDLAVSANGGFTFATPLAAGTAYAVAVKTQPAGQACTVKSGSGTLGSANQSSVEVACATQAAALPEGDWEMTLCSQVLPGTWGRTLWRIARQSDTRAAIEQGMVLYSNSQCAGTGTVQTSPAGALGTVAFDRTGATATLAAFWGAWSQPTGLTSRTVWARKGAYLCVLGDTTPSVLPTAQAVESAADLSIAGKGCYTKR